MKSSEEKYVKGVFSKNGVCSGLILNDCSLDAILL
jgi:hypothetical protein